MDVQGELRDELCTVLLRYVADKRVTLVQAATAGMGAVAVIIGALPEPARPLVADLLCENLLDLANKRAGEIRRGEFDARVSN